MPRKSSALTVAAIRRTKPAEKPIKLSDGAGMYLLLKPDGSRYWRLDYRFDGKRKTLALGVYPEITLSEARARRGAARALLAKGRDPAASRPRRTRVAAAEAGAPRPTAAGVAVERRRDTALNARRQRLLQTIAAVSELLLADMDETELMRHICQTLVKDHLFRMAWIGLVADGSVSVHPVAQAGLAEGYLEQLDIRCDASPQGQGPTGSAIRTGKTVVNEDTETNRRFAPWRTRARALGYRSSAATPIWQQNRVIGALNVYSAEPQSFGTDEILLLEKLATDLGIALERSAALYALRESEAMSRLLLESSPEAIFGVNTEGVCTFVNPACLRMLGYACEADLVGKNIHPLIHHSYPDGRPYPKESCHVRLSTLGGQSTHVDNEVHWRADGTCFPVEYWSRPMYRDGRLIGAVVNFMDITERKHTEEALRDSEARFRAMAEHSADLIWAVDTQGRHTYANRNLITMLGYEPDEVISIDPSGLVHPDDLALYRETHDTAVAQKTGWRNVVLRWRHRDGSYRVLESTASPLFDETGELIGFQGIDRDITERKAAEERIEFLAHHDVLTGLPNRILLRDRFEQALHQASRDQVHVAMLFIDLDNFKIVNDTLGHASGDKLLQSVVSRIGKCMRDTDTVCRQGGDEFILLLNDIEDIQTVERVAGGILAELTGPFDVNGHILNISCSIGVGLYPEDGQDFDTLLQKADAAMYNAKEAGRNAYRFFSEAMNRRAHEHLLLQNRMHQALSKGEFSLEYQPQLDLASGRVLGAEALLRWHCPELGAVAPGRFIPVAEDSGFIVPLGAWVLQEACRQAQTWSVDGLPELGVSVNLSALQFRRGNLVETVAHALRASGLAPHLLELELTESILLQNVEVTLATVRQLKALGVRLSIDDFGTGYSSLSYLKRFTVDKLKIDQSFVRDIGTDPDDAAIVRAIIQMARSLRLGIIAEGVENTEQLEFLRSEGCQEIQGYHFSRPLTPENFRAFMRGCGKPRH